METISIKLEEDFVETIEKVMKKHNYTTKTEFIREAMRERIKDLEKEEALLRLEKAYGAGAEKKRSVTDKELHRAREKAFEELERELK